MKRSPILGYNHNVRYAGRLWHIQTEDSGVGNPRIFTHLFHEGTILATKRGDYDPEMEVHVVQKLMQEQHKQLLRELKGGAFDEKIGRFFGVPVAKEGEAPPAAAAIPDLPPPTAPPVDFARSETLLAGDAPPLVPGVEPLPGPMTDPSMPAITMPIAEPSDFDPDNEDSLEISIEPGAFEPPPAVAAPVAPAATPLTGPMPIPPVPVVPRQPSMNNLPRPSSSPAMPRQSSMPAVQPPQAPATSPKLPSIQPAQTAQSARSATPTSTPSPSVAPRIPSPGQGVPVRTPAPTPPSGRVPAVRPMAPAPTKGAPPVQPARNPTGTVAAPMPRTPSGPKLEPRSPSPVRAPTGSMPPTGADDPLSQIPIFAAAPPSAAPPPAQQPPQRRDATPLRVPTRTGSQKVDSPVAPRRQSITDAQGVPRRQSQSHGVVKPTSEGVVVARPAVVIGGAAPPANAPRSVPSRQPTNNRWHQSGPPGAPPPPGQAQQRGKGGFGSDLISERSLDEVILAYLSEDAKDK